MEPVTRFFIRDVFGDGLAVWDNKEKKYATRIVKDRGNARSELSAVAGALEAVDDAEWNAREWREVVVEVITAHYERGS